MKATWMIIGPIAAVIAMAGIAGCSDSSKTDMGKMDSNQAQQSNTNTSKMVQYTCSMHPDVVQDKPGKCPKCGMTLVEKK